jgi:hypothetical protein
MLRLSALIAAAALLAACATAPVYVAAPAPNKAGYTHTQVESNRFFVTYRAPGGGDARLVEDFALLRAAELTLEQGADWFVVDRRSTDAADASASGPRVGVGVGGGSYGRRSGVSTGVGISFPLGGGGPRATASTLEIRTGAGEKPDGANVYDARAVSSSLRAQIAGAR